MSRDYRKPAPLGFSPVHATASGAGTHTPAPRAARRAERKAAKMELHDELNDALEERRRDRAMDTLGASD